MGDGIQHDKWRRIVAGVDGGKVVGGARYVHESAVAPSVLAAVRAAVAAIGGPGEGFNVLKLVPDSTRFSLLNYPLFFERPFPLLLDSWTVDLAVGTCDHRSYDPARNPPILHRKELLLAADDPRREEFAALTAAVEARGLFANVLTIGHRNQWEELLRAKGLRVEGHTLVSAAESDETVLRHRTAMARRALSTPMQALWRHGYLDGGKTVFDYGCGRGDDLAALAASGVAASGWDPYFRPEGAREEADVVNLGFVLNVIEDPEERRGALTRAYALARNVLCVGAMIGGRATVERYRAYGDGVLTSRQTFQKYYGHEELGEYIAGVLGREPVSVGPGLYFVLRSDEDEQDFLESRQRSSGRFGAMPTTPARPAAGPRVARAKAPTRAESDAEEVKRARARRMGDLSVFLALNLFERRRSAGSWGARAAADLRKFWGSYPKALEAAQVLLFSLRDVKTVEESCVEAAALGLGWLVPGESLQVDARLVNELPPALRVYIGCAGKLYGEAQDADVVKVHIGSGKVSLMRYDDYEGNAVPMLVERVKVDLRRQQVSYYAYGEGTEFESQPLWLKARYMHPAMEGYAGQKGFDEELVKAAGDGVDWSGYGPELATMGEVLSRLAAPTGMRVMGGSGPLATPRRPPS